MINYQVKPLAPPQDLETKAILKKATLAHRFLAELKGKAKTIPNQSILISTLTLQEAKDSSAVESIITTHDELYKASFFSDYVGNPEAKEVVDYARALNHGFALVKNHNILTNNHIQEIQGILEKNNAGFRTVPGTKIEDKNTNEIIHTPPQDQQEILMLMADLEQFINDDDLFDLDPLVKMAIIHFQFESIHPFYDGNGRTGRIINILYLITKQLLDIPVLYLSRHIIQNKPTYYTLLQEVQQTGNFEPWILYLLEAVHRTSIQTIRVIDEIGKIMMDYKHGIRKSLPKIYSQDLINSLFKFPYTRITSLQSELGVSRITATKYLNQLTEKDFLEKLKLGRNSYYVNAPLMDLLANSSEAD